jgi:hypothetical protein
MCMLDFWRGISGVFLGCNCCSSIAQNNSFNCAAPKVVIVDKVEFGGISGVIVFRIG